MPHLRPVVWHNVRRSASPDLQNEFVGAVIGAMESHTDLSTQILNNSEISQKLMGELVPIIYRALKETA
jgi:type I restriction enzyme R subunit